MLAACLSLPISSAQRERSLSSSTSFLSISSMRRRQSARFMALPRSKNGRLSKLQRTLPRLPSGGDSTRFAEGSPRQTWPPKQLPRSEAAQRDRKSTRLNSSHTVISYAVFCLKEKIRLTNGLV